MSLTVANWNMQGAGADKFARAKSSDYDLSNTDILLLQETGNPDNGGLKEGEYYYFMGEPYYCGVVCTDPTAVALRCTNAILIRASLATKASHFGAIEIVGYRYIPYVVYCNIAFASIHAPAIDDPQFAIGAVKSVYELSNGCDWVLMGDYNTDPLSIVPNGTHWDTVNEVDLLGTKSRPQLPCLLIYPCNATQGPGGKRERRLDYAFLSESLSRYRIWGVVNSRIYESSTPNIKNTLSDHNMVAITMRI